MSGRITRRVLKLLDSVAARLLPKTRERASHLVTGGKGEEEVYFYLRQHGYVVVARNWRSPRRRSEIDLIGWDGPTLCFVEVKTRRSDEFTPVITNVDLRKQRQIIRTAKVYRRIFNVYDMRHRYDVVTVLMPKYSDASLKLVKGFWAENKFRKTGWQRENWNEFY